MPTVREFEQAFLEDPSHQPAFLALRKAYREKQRFDKLVTLYESRAQASSDEEEAAELYYLAAEVRLEQLADPQGGETVLQYALERKPGHVKSAERLKLLYRDQGRTTDYLTMLEMTAAAVVESGDAQRRANLDAEMAQLFTRHIERLETAVQGPQRAQEITPDALRTLVSARKIHKALGDWARVVRLYDLEAAATADPKRRADLLFACAKLLVEKTPNLQTALEHVNEALRLRPNDERMIELQATIFSSPQWQSPDGQNGKEQAAKLLYQLARRRNEAGDLEGAISLSRRGLAAQPGHNESSAFLEKILRQAGRLRDLDRYYRERTAEAVDKEQKIAWLHKRAKLAQDELKDEAEALRCYEDLVSLEAPGGAAAQHLASLYGGRKNYAKLAELRERQLAVVSDPQARLPLLRDLASLYRDRLGDADQGAVYLHAILQIEPLDEAALKSYGDHFRRRGDFNALADLLEFAADSAQAAGSDHPKVAAWLEEVAGVAERNLNDTARALSAWRKLEAMGLGVEQARETQKRLLLKEKRWDGLAEVLSREAAAAPDDAARIEVWRRLGKVYLDKLAASEKAVETYRCILAADPRDADAFRAVVDILEAEQKWAALADVIAAHLGYAQQLERVAWLRRLGALYSERLERPADAAGTARAVLELVPGDRESFLRLEAMLEATGDLPALAQTLIDHAHYLSPGDKGVLLARAARLYQNDLEQPQKAAPLWERVLALEPGDRATLDALTALYEELQQPVELARVLQLQVERAIDDPVAQVAALRRMAHLAEGPLADPARALAAWEALREHLPSDSEALVQLSNLYRSRGEHRKLAEVLGTRVASVPGAEDAVALALERAEILERDLRSAGEAIEVLDQIVDGLDSRNAEAFSRLRRLSEAEEDWQKVASVAERQMLLQEDPQARVNTAMEIAVIHRDRLGDPDKAIAVFERVLGMAPEHKPALEALARLYTTAGETERLVAINEKLLALTEDDVDRRRLMFEIADACEAGLSDPRKAFAWLARAHAELPNDDTWSRLEALTEGHGLWDELIRVYETARARATTAQEQVTLSEAIAQVYEERVGDPARAFSVLREALSAEPAGETLLPQMERLASVVGDWHALLDVYTRVARGRPLLPARADLLQRRAYVFESHLHNPSAAMDEWLRRFSLDHADEVAREEILRLAVLTARWEDALKVYGQLFARATDVEQKVELAKKAAALVEERVKDRVRAFRAYLNAFRLAPQDGEILGHLWRLAGLIGYFNDSRHAHLPELVVQAVGRSSASPDATMFLAVSPSDVGSIASSIIEDVTDTLNLDDVEEVDGPASRNGAPPMPMAAPPLPSIPTPPPVAKQIFDSAWAEFANAYVLLPALDTSTRRSHLLKIAAIWEKGANQTDKAFEALEKAFRLDPFDPEVRVEIERLAEERSDWDRLCEIYLDAIDSSLSIEEAVRLHHDVAAFRESMGQRDKAEERYLAIVNLRPHDRKALDQLEDIYRTSERWADLAGLLERRRNEADLGQVALRSKSIELARLYYQNLDRPYEAIDTLEHYLSAFDDEPAGPHDPERLAELRRVLDDITRLYGRVDLWNKAASATQRSLDLESDPEARKKLALVLARIYEKEMNSPAKASDAYAALLEDHPDDPETLAALDRLYESQGRYEELAGVLERRIAIAEPAEKLALVKRRSRVLEERLGNPDAAAANLRGLGPELLDDDEIAGSLLRNLRRAGLGHEAARLLSQRIERMINTRADLARVVALHLELARVRLEDMSDVEGALAALQAARALEPKNVETLSALARLHLKAGNFAAFAQARAEEAQALGPGAEAARALLEAARVQLDQLRNPVEAQQLFQMALQMAPDNVEAVRALSSLLKEQGDTELAQKTLREFLANAEEPVARAEALTDLGRMVMGEPGRATEASALFEEAIDLAPDLQPAIVALANLHYQERQWEQAERRLMQALRRLKNNVEAAEPLISRLAEVYEMLGRPDDGYRQLQEADKKNPGRLRVKLALGRNRFLMRKWREVVAHLENIDTHADAAANSQEVGEALAMAGESSLKLKQIERARELFGRALKHAPSEGRARLSMASLEMAAGNLHAAAEHLSQSPADAVQRSEKVVLLEQLGDAHQQQGHLDEARLAYEQAVALVESPTAAHLALFDKALALQKAAGAVAAAAETSARLIGLEADPKQRAKRRREAAATLVKHNQLPRAAELLVECLDDDATDEVALAALVDVHEKLGTPEASMVLLDRILPTLPAPSTRPQSRTRRVNLWYRLGQLRLSAAKDSARRAFEHGLQIDPTHVPSREALARLYVANTDAELALANHRALAAANPTRAESLRAVAQAYVTEGKLDGARCVYEVLSLLGLNSPEDGAFLQAHPTRALKVDEPYEGVLPEPARRKHLLHPEAAAMADVFSTIWEGGTDIDGPSLEELGVSAEDKISPLSEQDVAKIFAEVSKALDNQKPSLYVAWDPKVQHMEIALTRPPGIVMPSALATAGDTTQLRFWIGRSLELTRPENVLGATINARAFSHLFGSVLKAFHPRHARRRGNDSAADAAARLKKALPYRVAKRLGELFAQMGDEPFSSARWRAVVEETGNRAGLLACGDVGQAARALLGRTLGKPPADVTVEELREHASRPGPLAGLLRFAVSESHLTLRAELGLAVDSAAAA